MAAKQNKRWQNYTPSPEQIRRATERIQAGWTKSEREKRAGGEVERWVAPVFIFDATGVAEVADNVI